MSGWALKNLALPQGAKKALEDSQKGVATPFSLSIQGQSIGVHNWTHGKQEKSNKYLSPVNAIAAIAAKLSDYRDENRPKTEQDCILMMISADNIGAFIAELEKVAVLMPDPVIKQALDYAKSSRDLETVKMIKTPQISHPSFGKLADITPQSARMLNSVMQNVQTTTEITGDPFQVLEQLKQRKAEKAQKNQEKITALLNTSAKIYAYKERGLLDAIALNIGANVPLASNGFCVLLCFVGDNLSQLESLLHD